VTIRRRVIPSNVTQWRAPTCMRWHDDGDACECRRRRVAYATAAYYATLPGPQQCTCCPIHKAPDVGGIALLPPSPFKLNSAATAYWLSESGVEGSRVLHECKTRAEALELVNLWNAATLKWRYWLKPVT
jgi:hypothetical protein